MAAAIVCLGLSDAFDSVYGSSAGSIIGSYFVSRQLYLDVYTDVIPAGKDLFVSKSKIIGDIFRNMFAVMKAPIGRRLNDRLIERFGAPAAAALDNSTASVTTRAGGLNTSFVLDSIMCPHRGLRPLDLGAFAHNDAVQPLRIVSSSVEVETGRLRTVCFGSKDGHFRDCFGDPSASGESDSERAGDECNSALYPEIESAEVGESGFRRGLWACLGASMTVPGAAGSPFQMNLPSSGGGDNNTTSPHLCFDAFCYEPVPYRSAVAEGATHVVALRSRPASFVPPTRPTLYERAVAPLYFRSNGVETAAKFFEKGGQQYLYAEDVLTCDAGLDSTEAIPIPPPRVLYANPVDEWEEYGERDRRNWRRAHLLPVTVAADVPELSTLSQDRDDILSGMRSGFAAAYDALAPVVGLGSSSASSSLDGMDVAELVFPDVTTDWADGQLELQGEKVRREERRDGVDAAAAGGSTDSEGGEVKSSGYRSKIQRLLSVRRKLGAALRRRRAVEDDREGKGESIQVGKELDDEHSTSGSGHNYAERILSHLPAIQLGSVPLVAERLQSYLEGSGESSKELRES